MWRFEKTHNWWQTFNWLKLSSGRSFEEKKKMYLQKWIRLLVSERITKPPTTNRLPTTKPPSNGMNYFMLYVNIWWYKILYGIFSLGFELAIIINKHCKSILFFWLSDASDVFFYFPGSSNVNSKQLVDCFVKLYIVTKGSSHNLAYCIFLSYLLNALIILHFWLCIRHLGYRYQRIKYWETRISLPNVVSNFQTCYLFISSLIFG